MKHSILSFAKVLAVVLPALLISEYSYSNSSKNEQEFLVESKLRMLDYVMQRSATVKRIQESKNSAAKQELEKAVKARNLAHQLMEKKQYAKAGVTVDKALQTITSANRLLIKKHSKSNKAKNRYETLQKTINSFVETFSQELTANSSQQINKQQIDSEMAKAAKKSVSNNYQQANQILEEVYQNLKEFIYQQRDNKTLVYSLDFANDKEEYEYEQKRFKSFQLLLEMAEKKNANISNKSKSLVKQFVSKSDALNQQAEELAKKEKYHDAIKKLEESAQHLTRALRTMGLMIP